MPGRVGIAQRTKAPALADEFGTGTTLSDRCRRTVCCLLRQRRNLLPPGARLAGARARAGPVHRIPQPHQRRAHRQRRQPARCARLIMDWTASARSRRTKCAPWSCVAVHGPTSNGQQSSTIAKATSRRWHGCCRPCCPRSICRAPLLRGRYMAAAAQDGTQRRAHRCRHT